MSHPPLHALVCSLYQEILHHPDMEEMGFGREDADDDLTNSVAFFLQKQGVAVDLLLYEVNLINLITTGTMAMYVRALRLDDIEFDLMGNRGKDDIILDAMKRHHSEVWKEFQWKTIHVDPPVAVGEPKQVWDVYLDERLGSFLQHQHIQAATRCASARRHGARL